MSSCVARDNAMVKANHNVDSLDGRFGNGQPSMERDCAHTKESLSNVELGIFVDFDFGWDEEGAWQAKRSWEGMGLDCDDLVEGSTGWQIRVRVDLFEVQDLSVLIDQLEQIGWQYGGRLVENANKRAIEEVQKTTQARRRFAKVAHRLGKYEESIDRWREMQTTGMATRSEASLWIGWAALLRGNWEDARQEFEIAIAESRDIASRASGLCGMGWCLFRQQKTVEAEAFFLEALALETQAESQFGMACCRMEEGAVDAGLGWLRLACASNPACKEASRKEPAFEAVRYLPLFQHLSKVTWKDRIWLVWNRLPFPSNRRSDFVDRMRISELY